MLSVCHEEREDGARSTALSSTALPVRNWTKKKVGNIVILMDR